jgi:signal transduction histidine kinase
MESSAGPRPGPAYLTARVRWLTLGALSVLAVIGVLIQRPGQGGPVAIAGAVVAVGAGVLLTRASARLVLPCAALAAAGVTMYGTGDSADVGWFAICLLAGWCAVGGPRRAGLIFWAGCLLLFAGQWIWTGHDPGWVAWAGGTGLTVLAAALLRRQFDLVEQLRAAQAGLAERSRAEERNRIAREVHDVIAHSLTVSLLHLSSARLAVDYEPEEAAQALAEAERLCRQSLDEVRNTVGLLRQDGGSHGTEPPVPGADRLDELASRFRVGGTRVSLLVDGDIGRLPATTGAAIYRIVQESLTNTAKHAPGAPVEVRLAVEPGRAVLRVDSAGPPGHGQGLGLISMRERAEAVGGTCSAGPGGEGWTVRAELPLVPSRGVAS